MIKALFISALRLPLTWVGIAFIVGALAIAFSQPIQVEVHHWTWIWNALAAYGCSMNGAILVGSSLQRIYRERGENN